MRPKKTPKDCTPVPDWVFTSSRFSAGYDRMTFVALLFCADANGVCSPSVAQLAKMVKFSTGTVAKALDRLESSALIARHSAYDEYGGRTSNVYRIALAADEQVGEETQR